MRDLKSLSRLILTLSCLLISGCSPVTLGPQVRTEYVILHPGKPVQILEKAKVRGRALDGTGDAVEQDVGGWVAMPESHWKAVKEALGKK
jgi:hypothetical protein